MTKHRNHIPHIRYPMGEFGACYSKESLSNGHDEWERQGDPDTPIDETKSLHRLSEAELCNEEGPLPSIVQRPNPGLIGRIKLLLLTGWIFGLQLDYDSSRQSREDDVHMSFWHVHMLPFRLCNARVAFRRCMMTIFSDFLGDSLEVFMDDFCIFGNDFDICVAHLTKILEDYVRKRLVLSWDKSYFMVWEGVVLGHIVLGKGLEEDKAKIEVIQNLPLLATVWDLRSFLGNVGFYQRFIQDFVKVFKPLTTLLCKDKDFITDKEGTCAFVMLKQALINVKIHQSPN